MSVIHASGLPVAVSVRDRQYALDPLQLLAQAAVLRRLHDREEAKLSEDGDVLSSIWAELGT